MATVVRKRKGTREYYYLRENVRDGKSVTTRDVYLGARVPKDVEERAKALRLDAFRAQWIPRLDRLQAGFLRANKQASPSEATKDLDQFAVQFTYDTQRIEGSTLSLRETADLLEHGLTPAGKPVADVKEAEAHRDLFHRVLNHQKELTHQAVLEWHRRQFLQTKPDIAGRWRRHGVKISGSRFLPPSPVEVEPLLGDFFAWYRRSRDKIHPVERAALTHLKFVTIHPFADGNGRLSRL